MPVIICRNCGVELEDDMLYCPLCGEPVTGNGQVQRPLPDQQLPFPYRGKMDQPQKKFTWEIVSLVLLTGIIATFVVDYILNQGITWSEYPVAVSLAVFCYVSLFVFWHQRMLIQLAGSLLLSCFFLVILDALTGDIEWSVKLGIPLLFAVNLVAAVLMVIFRHSKYKGVNLIAYAFVGAAFLCIGIEGVISVYKTESLHLAWSVIVTGCLLPVVLVLLFVHFRLKKGRSLEKTFHL